MAPGFGPLELPVSVVDRGCSDAVIAELPFTVFTIVVKVTSNTIF